MRNDAIDVKVNKGLLAFWTEEEGAVGGVVHEEVFGEDGRATKMGSCGFMGPKVVFCLCRTVAGVTVPWDMTEDSMLQPIPIIAPRVKQNYLGLQ